MVCIRRSIARLAGHKESGISDYTSFFFLPFYEAFSRVAMIGDQQQDVHEGQNNGAVEPENDVEALLAGVDFQQPQVGMGEQQIDDLQQQGLHFEDINDDRGFQQQPP